MVRRPFYAGTFYPSEKKQLLDSIKECFLSDMGPGKLPVKKRSGAVLKGLVSPHAGYSYSGPCAAFGFGLVGEAIPPESIIIIGPSHSGFPSCISEQDWATPLGVVKTDKKLADSIGLPAVEEAHENEHSVEVQLPFLQFVLEDFKFVPVIANTDLHYCEIAEMIRQAIGESKKRILVIASSDFTHYGKSYGFVPVSADVKEWMKRTDFGAIGLIKKLDAKGFVGYASEKTTICGTWPIAVLLEILSKSASRMELLKYYTSGDITGDYSNAVGYASIVFS